MLKRVESTLCGDKRGSTNHGESGRPTHSQLIAISVSGSIPRLAIFGMSFTRSIYAALQPVPKMQAIRVLGFT